MQAACDATGMFRAISAGWAGSANDASIFDRTWGRWLDVMVEPHHFLIADGAYPIGEHLMKPYSMEQLPEKHASFNYLLSRGRVIIEQAFGQLKARWRCLVASETVQLRSMQAVSRMIACCCTLHNMIIKYDGKPVREVAEESISAALPGIASWDVASRHLWRKLGIDNESDLESVQTTAATATGYVSFRPAGMVQAPTRLKLQRETGTRLRDELSKIADVVIRERHDLWMAFMKGVLPRARRMKRARGTYTPGTLHDFPAPPDAESDPEHESSVTSND